MDEQQTVDETQAKVMEHNQLVTQVKAIPKILNGEQFEQVDQWRRTLKSGIDYFDNLYDDRISEANKLHKGLIADRDGLKKTAVEGFKYSGQLLANYNAEQERIRVQKQREAEALEKKRAQDEKDRLLQIAKDLGDKEQVKEIKAAPPEVKPIVIEKDVPKVEGLHFTSHKHYDVENLMLLVKAVAAGKVPIGALDYNAGFIRKQTTDLYDSTPVDKDGVRWLYPGVKIWETKDAVQKG